MKTKSIIIGFMLILSIFLINTHNVAASSPSLLISEVAYDGIGTEANSEFVELFNPTTSDISLTGWSISDNVGTFSLSGTITAGNFFTIGVNQAGFEATYGVVADLYGSTLALGNSGDQVILSQGATQIDFVAWENYATGWNLVATTGNSLHRTSTTDTDTTSDFVVEAVNPTTSNYLSAAPPGPDTQAPIVSITSPSNGATVYRTVTVITSSSDNVGVTTQEITIDGNIVSTTGTFSWDTTTVVDGSHIIASQVWDAAGNSGTDTISVTVDNANAPPIGQVGNVKIMSYNVEASGLNPDWKIVVQEENPDIAFFIETGDWDNSGDTILQGYCSEFNTFFTNENPYTCVQTTGVAYATSGEAIFSRFPVLSTNQVSSLTLDDGSTISPSHDFLDATIDVGGSSIHFIAAHLKCCGGATNEAKRAQQQEGIINYMDNLGNVPVVFAGDLNSFSPEDTGNLGDLMYQPMSMMLQDTTYHDVSSSYSSVHTFDDPLTTLYPGQFFPSYGHQNPTFTSRIDFITMNQHFSASNYVSATVGDTPTADTGSDHYSTDVTYNFGSTVTDTNPPTQVTGLSATTVSDTQIDLNWTAATDDVGVTGYNIYRNSTLITTVATTTYSDTGLIGSTTYSYTVSAKDAAGNEGLQSMASLATTNPTVDTTAPNQVTGLIVNPTGETTIDLSWNVGVDNIAVDHYNIYRDNVFIASTTTETYSDSGLTLLTSYTYQVSAVDTSNNEGLLSSATIATTLDTTAPNQVSGLSAISAGQSSIALSWTAATDNSGSIDHYNIYRDSVLIGASSTTSFSDSGLSPSTSYTYTVSAVDASNNEGISSAPASATTDIATLDHIIISEVYYDATGNDAKGEWIEIYNPTGSTVDLSGWTMQDNGGTYTFANGVTIAPGQFLIIARDSQGFFNLHGFYPDIANLNLALGNSGDYIILNNNLGNPVDQVAWEGRLAGWDIRATTGQSIARVNLTTDTDTVSDWVVVSNEGTPGY